MKIGLFTDSLQDRPITGALDWAARHGIEAVEFGTGNFSPAPHCDVSHLLGSETARQELLSSIESRGLALSALNCNGNLLDPHPQRGETARAVFHQTVELAGELGLDTVVTMSGCPGDPSGSPYPNWVTHPWQREFVLLHRWQWEEVIAPFWSEAGRFAADRGVRVAIEMHPGQAVYNTNTLLRLREIGGPSLGANLDPSHLFYQGMDPLLVVRSLGQGCIFHVHAKDAVVDPYQTARSGGIDMRPMDQVGVRPWTYRTVGFGHDALWWRGFVSALRGVGFDGVLSIEHEDVMMGNEEGIIKSVEFLKPIVLRTTA